MNFLIDRPSHTYTDFIFAELVRCGPLTIKQLAYNLNIDQRFVARALQTLAIQGSVKRPEKVYTALIEKRRIRRVKKATLATITPRGLPEGLRATE